jgi:endonuclease/exonuclease/phosphatase family metal-dependent hydrolase
MERKTIRVLTLNTWMLRTPFGLDIAEDIDERLRILPDKVASTGADWIAFQENWDPRIRKTLVQEMRRRGYPYEASHGEVPPQNRLLGIGSLAAACAPLALAHRGQPLRRDFLKQTALLAGTVGLNAFGAGSMAFDSVQRSMGNGLQIFSRFPLTPPESLCFSEFTRADEVLVRKGAIKTVVTVPGLGPVDLYTSHLGAVTYRRDLGQDEPGECAARLRQMRELTAWIARSRTSPIAVLAGDMNTDYREFRNGGFTATRSQEYRSVVDSSPSGLGFQDTYAEVHGREGTAAITDDSRNPYKNRGHFSGSPDVVIDYIFLSPQSRLRPVASEVVFQEPISAAEYARHGLKRRPERLSDHYGVLTTLAFS